MRVALICNDKPGAGQLRLDHRSAHLAYIAATEVVELAGPLLDEAGQMCGSLIVLEVADLATARGWAAADPYAVAGLFDSVTINAWKKVVG